MSLIDKVLEIVKQNFTLVVALIIGYLGAVDLGMISAPEVPDGTGLVFMALVLIAIGGWIAAGKIEGLLPEPEGVYIVEFDCSDDTGGAVYNLSEDQFADMEVHAGSLFQWPVAKQVYEVREYRPEENVAVANWRESVAGSELAGNVQVVDALDAIDELRTEFEPAEQRLRILKRSLRSVARRMDRRRDRDQQAIVDPHINPEFGDESATVSDIIYEEMPEHLLPESMRATEQTQDEKGEAGEFAGFEILDDMDEPAPQPMMNDD